MRRNAPKIIFVLGLFGFMVGVYANVCIGNLQAMSFSFVISHTLILLSLFNNSKSPKIHDDIQYKILDWFMDNTKYLLLLAFGWIMYISSTIYGFISIVIHANNLYPMLSVCIPVSLLSIIIMYFVTCRFKNSFLKKNF